MNRIRRVLQVSVWLLIVMIGIVISPDYAVSSQQKGDAALIVELLYPDDFEVLERYESHLELTLLPDDNDLMEQINALQEQSKTELEPLVKQYMYAAETLNLFSAASETNDPEQKTQLIQDFTAAETGIQQTLERYTTMITELLHCQTCQKIRKTPLLTTTVSFHDLAPGRYRVYGVLTYTTTTLTWFEPVDIQGGERRTITFTRDNLNNPYWTTLNWWSFLNLDFSKHH